MRMIGARFEWLMDDLQAAVDGVMDQAKTDPSLWERGLRGKWTAGQNVEHLAIGLTLTADSLEMNERALENGTLPKRRLRGPLQMLFVGIAIGAGKFPRGGRAPRQAQPAAHPVRAEVLARIAGDVARHRALGGRLSVEDRDRLWIPNPYMKGWHYVFPEVLRMQAVHFRHHARSIDDIVAKATAARPS